ncbi:MAG: phosphohistidine phosphatase SixA [Kouleothrix sp.]|nr:phosphohistidine phosphatase SixA [Kouleothrix sp.]
MELYFLRHGIAEDVGPEGAGDAGRRLTKEGIAKMKDAARGLKRIGVRLDVLLTSPLARAHQTAEIVARELGVELRLADALSPGCNVALLFELLGEHRAAERVMVVGHEPDFSTMIAALAGGGRIQLKKGGLARIDLEVLEAGGTLVWLLPPKVLRG